MLPCFPTHIYQCKNKHFNQSKDHTIVYIHSNTKWGRNIGIWGNRTRFTMACIIVNGALKCSIPFHIYENNCVFFPSWSTKTRYCGWNFTWGKTEDPDGVFELYRGEQRFWVCGRFVFIIFIWFSDIKIYTRVRLFISERYWIGELKTF